MSRELFDTSQERAQFDQYKAEAHHAIEVMLTEYRKAITEGVTPDEAMVATSSLLRMFVDDTGGDVIKYLVMAVRIMAEKGVRL
jgi:hypothetical protein